MRERAAALTGCRAFCSAGRTAVCAGGRRPSCACYLWCRWVAGAVGPGRCVCWWAAAFLCVLLVVTLVLRAPSGPAAREIAARELRSEWSISKPARALRTLRHPPQQWRMVADRWLGASSRSPARLCRRPPAPRPGPSLRWGCRVFACGDAGVAGAVGSGRPRDRRTRACGSEWSISKPARALRTLRHPPHRRRRCTLACARG